MIIRKPVLSTLTWFLVTSTNSVTEPAIAQRSFQVGVQHSEKLLPPGIPGRSAGASEIATDTGADDWFPIPGWLGGTWICTQALRTFKYDESSGTSDASSTLLPLKGTEVFGWQKDSHGNEWTCRSLGKALEHSTEHTENTSSKNGGNEVEVKIHEDQLISHDKDHVSLKTTDSIIEIDKSDNAVTHAETQENFRRIVPISDDLIAVYSDIRTFDKRGFPSERSKLAAFYRRSAPFTEQDEYEHRNLRSSFSKYLTRTGQMQLIPPK